MNKPIQYRTLRSNKRLKVNADTQAQVSGLLEVEWQGGSKGRQTKRTLKVQGLVREKGPQYPVEWRFPVSDEDFTVIGNQLEEMIDAVREWGAGIPAALERELYIDALDWLRIGFVFINTDERQGHYGYFEFSKDGQKLRAEVEDIPTMEEFRRVLMP